jgi:hypothetical protein
MQLPVEGSHGRQQVLSVSRATIYVRSEFGFGYSAREVRNLRVSIGPFAQYARGVYFEYTPKGARSARAFVQAYGASLVVIEGWGHALDLGSPFGEPVVDPVSGVTTVSTRAMSCDPSWTTDFRAKLAAYIERTGASKLADFHGHEPGCR